MTTILYAMTAVLLALSAWRDVKKTKKALKKAWKAFENILPQFLGVIVLVGLMMAIFDADLISKIIGEQSGILGMILSALIGSLTLIPGFVAFPTAAILLENGAGYTQIAAFVSTLMMVGIMTLPVEIQYFGKEMAWRRNILAFFFSFIVAIIVGKVASGVWL